MDPMRADRWAVVWLMATTLFCTHGSAPWAWIPAVVAILAALAVALRFAEWLSSGPQK